MVVVSSLRAALRIAPRPHAHVHGVDGRRRFASGKRMASEQAPQGLGIDSSTAKCVVEAAPPTAMGRPQAQVHRRRGRLRAEEGIGEFEEGVGAAMEAAVERVSEGA
jgi:hypothetical protein